MPVFFKRNLDPFENCNLIYSWNFTDSEGNFTLSSQQGGNYFSSSTSGEEPVSTENAVFNYYAMKGSSNAQYESDSFDPNPINGSLTVGVRIDCTVTNTTDVFEIKLVGLDDNSSYNIIFTVDNVDGNSNQSKISVIFNRGSSSEDSWSGLFDFGFHCIMCYYDYDYGALDVYVDGNSVYYNDDDIGGDYAIAPVSFKNSDILGKGLTDIVIFNTNIESHIPDFTSNNFPDLGYRKLDPFGDGSLKSAFRGVNNSKSDDELKNLFS